MAAVPAAAGPEAGPGGGVAAAALASVARSCHSGSLRSVFVGGRSSRTKPFTSAWPSEDGL
eukprot:12895854-Prorocentrum_lima.AAC.1